MAICEYLEETHKDRPLLPADPIKRCEVRRLCELINSGIQPLQNIYVLNKIGTEFSADAKKPWAVHFIARGLDGKLG